MLLAFRITLLLILGASVFLFVDGPIVQGLVGAFTVIGIVAGLSGLRRLEGDHLSISIQWMLVVMALPAMWIAIQLLPVPMSIAHPIWSSARDALGQPLFSHLSIDLGDTISAFGEYCTLAGVVLLAALVTLDRERAELTLSALTAVSAFSALILLVDRVSGYALIGNISLSGDRVPFEALACLGIPLTATAIDRAVERYETRGLARKIPLRSFFYAHGIYVVAFLICVAALMIAAPISLAFAATCGFGTLALIVAIRRLGLGQWSAIALIVGAVAVGTVFAFNRNDGSFDLTLRFASNVSAAKLSTAQRMVADNSAGSGAGTFGALLPIYTDTAEAGSLTPPSSAAKMSVELGKPALFVAFFLVALLIGLLLRGGLERGRDSFYAAGAAACTVTILIESFLDPSLFATPIMIIAAMILGLGFAQRLSRSLS